MHIIIVASALINLVDLKLPSLILVEVCAVLASEYSGCVE